MTIGLGVLCHGGDGIIMAADTRGSYTGSNPPPPHEQIGKQFILPHGFMANIAGTIKTCDAFVAELYARMENIVPLNGVIYHDHIHKAIHDAQFRECALRFDHELKMQLGISLVEWKQYEQTRQLFVAGKEIFRQTDFDCSVIVGGFLDKRPVLIHMVKKEGPEMTRNFAVIGSGADYAWDVLDGRGQNEHMSFLRTIVHICEAMEAAKQDPYVGEPAAFVILLPNGWTKRLDVRHPLIRKVVSDYTNKDTEPLDTDVARHREVTDLFYEDAPPLY